MESWTHNPEDENEPRVNLTFGGERFIAHRGNTRLYTFMGNLALYNHVFCKNDDETGIYIFNFIEGFTPLRDYMVENEFPMYLNMTDVAQCDIDAYDRAIAKSVKDIDTIPDEWL